MPMGKGTYASKVGRPPKNKKMIHFYSAIKKPR